MKFQATVTFEFQASSIGDAGQKLNDAVRHARDTGNMETKSIELRTPPSAAPVTLPVTERGVTVPGSPRAFADGAAATRSS
jgi:hypothetical protein